MKIPAIYTDAARAIWDRGRVDGRSFDELSDGQRADLIADSVAVVNSLRGRTKALDRLLTQVGAECITFANAVNHGSAKCETPAKNTVHVKKVSVTNQAAVRHSAIVDAAPVSAPTRAGSNTITALSREGIGSTRPRSAGGDLRVITEKERKTPRRGLRM